MFKKVTATMILSLCSTFIVYAPLKAEDEPGEKKYARVAERAISQEEQRNKDEEHETMIAQHIKEKGWPKPDLKIAKQKLAKKAIYYTTHPGAYHNLVVWEYYDSFFNPAWAIFLEDNSKWWVRPSQGPVVANWASTDALIITRNHGASSFIYDYKITNQVTGEAVLCNLDREPFLIVPQTQWIYDIDYLSRTVVLGDMSVWDISSFDDRIIYNWQRNDTIIICVNDNSWSNIYPNILLNVETMTHGQSILRY